MASPTEPVEFYRFAISGQAEQTETPSQARAVAVRARTEGCLKGISQVHTLKRSRSCSRMALAKSSTVIKQIAVSAVLALAALNSSYSIAFDQDAVQRLKSTLVCAGCDLSAVNIKGEYLPGANLANANLAGANLSEVNLNGANLSSANLAGADLSGASIKYSVMNGADLRGARLVNSNLSVPNWKGQISQTQCWLVRS